MQLEAFNKLVELLQDSIQPDMQQAARSVSSSGVEAISVELIVGMGLRFLGREHIKSLEDIFGVHKNHVRLLILEKFFPAVDACPLLELHLPRNENELELVAAEFSEKSESNGLFNGCVGAIDGWLCTTCQPIDPDITNKRSYYSGHYQKFGLNIQAVCDSWLRFLYFGVSAPGRTNDARDFLKCEKLGW